MISSHLGRVRSLVWLFIGTIGLYVLSFSPLSMVPVQHCYFAYILTIPSHPIAQARLERLQTQLSSQGIASAPVFGELAHDNKTQSRVVPMLDQFAWALRAIVSNTHGNNHCPSMTSSPAIVSPSPIYLLLEDDTSLHPHFARELSLTLQALPQEWQVLHLCIGFLWGRNHSPKNGTFGLRPDGPLSEVRPVAKNQRFLSHWPSRFATAGSPVAMAIRGQEVAKLLEKETTNAKDTFLRTTDAEELLRAARDAITDVMLANLAYRQSNHFVTATPQLCWEDDLSGRVANPL